MSGIIIKTTRKEDFKEVERLEVVLHDIVYRISESIDGKLTINKSDDEISIYPRYANQIDIL